MSGEWNATSYHKVSGPQASWGLRVLSQLHLVGDERIIDAGCGSGRLTAELLERVPRGRIVAVDRSWNMLQTARANLRPAFGPRVHFVQVALPALPFRAWADVVFSTATFHWVQDHAALFADILTALRPGGRLHAQCGGGPNLAAAHALAEHVMQGPPFAPYFEGWSSVWRFASPDDTYARLEDAGFTNIVTGLEAAPTTFVTEADYREFVTTVIYHPHLARLPGHLRVPFIDQVTARAAAAEPALTLDYWRLNIQAARPMDRVRGNP